MNQPTDAQQAVNQAIRLERAMKIVAELRKGGLYVAHNGSGIGKLDIQKRGFDGAKDVWYTVDLIQETCDCPDHMENGFTCKHILAAEIYAAELAAEDATDQHVRLLEDAECSTGCDGAFCFDR